MGLDESLTELLSKSLIADESKRQTEQLIKLVKIAEYIYDESNKQTNQLEELVEEMKDIASSFRKLEWTINEKWLKKDQS